jgi:DNA-binding NarL/FixJ family response regulator
MRPRLVLADDHQAVLDTVAGLLAPRFDVVGTAGDGLEALRLAIALRPDALILDLAMPGLDGLAVADGIRRAGLTAAIVILTVSEDPALADAALAAGVLGYVTKARAAKELVPAVDAAIGGRRFVSASVGGNPSLARSRAGDRPDDPGA